MAKAKKRVQLALVGVLVAASASAQVPAARSEGLPAAAEPGSHQTGGEGVAPTAPAMAEGRAGPGPVDAPTAMPAASPAAPASAAVVPPAPPNAPMWTAAPGTAQPGSPEAIPRYGTPVPQSESPEAATPERTYEYRFSVTLDLANVLWRSGTGYRLFSDTHRAWRIGLGLGYDLVQLPEHLVVALEAGYLAEPSHGTNTSTSSGLTGSVSASTVLIGGSLRYAITPWMAPYGRLGLLASRIAMDYEASSNTSSTDMSWSHHAWAPGGLVGAGVMLNLLPRTRVAAGLLVEGGLWLHKSVEMRLDNELPAGAIATTGARIGSLDNTGPYLRIAGVLRF